MTSAPHRVIFAGTPEFAVATLEALASDPAFDVTHVITQPDKPVGRNKVITPPPVKVTAETLGIPVWQPNNINDEWDAQKTISKEPFDFLVVVAYGQILSQKILDAPSIAPVNIHYSLLPKWRGAAPVQHAILAGDTETGITIQKMARKLDTGDILSQVITPLDGTERAEKLYDNYGTLGATLLVDTLKKPLQPTPQEESGASEGKKFTRKSGDIDFSKLTSVEIDRHVRALVPWPGVRTKLDGQDIKIISVSLTETADSTPVSSADGEIFVVSLQEPGKRPISGKEWKQRHR